jgi:hypothetical protein
MNVIIITDPKTLESIKQTRCSLSRIPLPMNVIHTHPQRNWRADLWLIHNIRSSGIKETCQEVDYRHLKWVFSVNTIQKSHFKILTIYVLSKNSNDTSHRLLVNSTSYTELRRRDLTVVSKKDIVAWKMRSTPE